jgi:catechol 2,3-dioxygenase
MLNTEIIIHPRLNHIGLTTDNLEPMIDWYRKVLGMTINHRSAAPTGARNDSSLTAAWASNDEVNHRLAFVELPGLTADPDRSRHKRVQHVAFEYPRVDDLLGTYVRLNRLGILPVLTAKRQPHDRAAKLGRHLPPVPNGKQRPR